MMRSSPSRVGSSARFEFYLLSALIFCLALWIRATNLYGTPIFFDEGDHIVWAQRFSAHNNTYPFLMDGKFLLGVLLAQFHVLGPAPLWVSRAVVAVFSLLSCAACVAIGRLLGSARGGLLAGLLYAVLPQAVFFERQTFADPLMASFGLAAVVCALRIAYKPRHWLAVPLAVCLGGAFLFKLFGLVYLSYPALAVLILPTPWKGRSKIAAVYTASVALAVVLVAIVLGSLRSRLGYFDGHLAGQQIGFIGCPVIICQGSVAGQLKNFWEFGKALAETLSLYVGWPTTVLALLAWPLSLPTHRRSVLFFSLGTLGMLIPFAFAAKGYVPPRYFSFLAAPVVILAALTLASIAARFSARDMQFRVIGVALLLITAWPTANLIPIVVALEKARLTDVDRQVYIWPWSGLGIREAAFVVWENDQPNQPPPVVLVGNIYVHLVGGYFDRTRIDVRSLGEAYPADLGRWLLAGQRIYIFDSLSEGEPPGLSTDEVGRYPRLAGPQTVSLRRVTGADSATRNEIYREFFVKPEKLSEDFRSLIDSLPQTDPVVLLVYPPNQAAALATWVAANRPNVTLISIGDSWPLDTAASANELSHIAANHATVRVVFVEETKGDPQRQIETWLNTHLFRLDEQWFGPVRLLGFAGGGEVTQTIPVGAQFGDGIQLESIDVLDSTSTPGGLVRLRLNWQALTPIAQQFKIFTHIFAGDRIIAQHDGQPVGELRPTTTWQSGETIVDQFAIRLPADAPPGDYQLRIGLYDLNTQVRLSFMSSDGVTGEFFVGDSVAVAVCGTVPGCDH